MLKLPRDRAINRINLKISSLWFTSSVVKFKHLRNKAMKSPLVHTIKLFLEKHWNPGRPILLGFSGGADSTALLHLVLECRQFFSVELVSA